MSATSELQRSRNELLALLEKKIGHMPEWKAYRAVERAIAALDPSASTGPAVPTPNVNGATTPRPTRRPADAPTPYGALALRALGITGMPVTTPDMLAFIGRHRPLPDDPDKAKVNVVSALSHDDRFQSIAWRDGRAWWHAGRAPPTQISREDVLRAMSQLTHS